MYVKHARSAQLMQVRVFHCGHSLSYSRFLAEQPGQLQKPTGVQYWMKVRGTSPLDEKPCRDHQHAGCGQTDEQLFRTVSMQRAIETATGNRLTGALLSLFRDRSFSWYSIESKDCILTFRRDLRVCIGICASPMNV